jgi:hypothetical protein
MKMLKGTQNQDDIDSFILITKALQAYSEEGPQIEGLYDRGAKESLLARFSDKLDELRVISHDNLTAIAAFSYLHDLPFAKDIYKFGMKKFWFYDNAYPDEPRLYFKKHDGKPSTSWKMHPRDWAYWSLCGGNTFLWVVLFPLFLFSQITTCMTEPGETSGKLLMFVRMECAYKKSKLVRFTRWICYKMMRKMYGENWLNEIMKIYFHQPGQPNAIISEDIKL